MYVPFEQMVRRQLQIYTDLSSRHSFMLRSYCADGMGAPYQDNTYIEVFMISEPERPWIVAIIDRAFVGATKLRIMEVKIYLGEIYILDFVKGLYRVSITPAEDLIY